MDKAKILFYLYRIGTWLVALGLTTCSVNKETTTKTNHAATKATKSSHQEPKPTQNMFSKGGLNPTEQFYHGLIDKGIFSDLDSQVRLELPKGLKADQLFAALDQTRRVLVLYKGRHPIKAYPVGSGSIIKIEDLHLNLKLRPNDHAELKPLLNSSNLLVFDQPVELPPGDRDSDGIPDSLDILLGAHKTRLNGSKYDERYIELSYPGGDVPRGMGVCTDVIIRALRNAGIDLQVAVHEDIRRSPRAYPMVKRPNPSIDHRRVKTLLPYFRRNFSQHTQQVDDPNDPLRPGDIVFMDTFPNRAGTEHVGIVSDRIGKSGLPLVINNWTNGAQTAEMDLLPHIPITYRYRVEKNTPESPIPTLATQLITVVTKSWTDSKAELRRFVRLPGHKWKSTAEPIDVLLGYGGYGWGNGRHGQGIPSTRTGPIKKEGDGRSPAGVFSLGRSYGYAIDRPTGFQLPYIKASSNLRCVDDPKSAYYNHIVDASAVKPDWQSAELMHREDNLYELLVVIEHNQHPPVPSRGSCIFLHIWKDSVTPMVGCTAMAKPKLIKLMSWLKPNHSVLVALPQEEYKALKDQWMLPTL